MRAASLFGVFILAKACVLAGRDIPMSAWTPITYLWQDLLVVLLFALLECVVRPTWITWSLYSLLVLYAAINVPVARVLSTPLTVPLLRAARGPLTDSVLYYLTWTNVGLVLLVLAAATAFPCWLPRCLPRAATR